MKQGKFCNKKARQFLFEKAAACIWLQVEADFITNWGKMANLLWNDAIITWCNTYLAKLPETL